MKKAVLIGMAVLLLASSLALVSCGDVGVGSNKFTGTWVTSSPVPATLKFGASDWTLTVPSLGITEKGNYTLGSIDTYAYLNQSGSTVGSAVISNGIMTVHFTAFGLNTISPQFTKQ